MEQSTSDLIIHGLSIFPESNGNWRIRSTIRTGNVIPGQELLFSTPNGKKYSLMVIDKRDGPSRHVTLVVQGDEEAISSFQGGFYLFGKNG